MKAAFAHWNSRIAPVFDVAREMYLVEVASGSVVHEAREILPYDLPVQRVLRLVELGVGTLICGAISRPLYEMVIAYGIRVIPFVAGDLREVIQAWLNNGLHRDAFTMPGCCGRGRLGVRGMHGMYREEYIMKGTRRGGMGPGGGRGQGRGGQRLGQGGQRPGRGGQRPGGAGGPVAAGSADYCVCPQCGQREPHQRGVPCFERTCPQCGTVMTRE